MIWDGFNQRRFPRVPIRCRVVLRPHRKTKKITAYTSNIGLGGTCVHIQTRLYKMSLCKVQIQLSKRYKILECQGKIAWIVPTTLKPKSKKKSYDVGIEFIHCPSLMVDRLRRIVDARIARSL